MMDYYNYNVPASNTVAFGAIWAIVAFILALVGCFLVYFIFVKKKVNSKNKFVLWLKDFLDFKSLFIEDYIKILYIFVVLLITLGSFSFISQFLVFLFILIGGNLIARVAFELILLKILIWKNTNEINKKMK